jgi:predicted enzyme related to lactoylglutathione lyase
MRRYSDGSSRTTDRNTPVFSTDASQAASRRKSPRRCKVCCWFYATDLVASQKKIKDAGGKIVKDIFAFPGGRRFHFMDPNGNELAVWSDQAVRT